jgi:hypothetical protein
MAQAAQVGVSSELTLLLATCDSSAGCDDHCINLI